MAQFFTQARYPRTINGQVYLVARGGRPPIGPIPQSRTARLSGFEVFGNGQLPPDDLNSRDKLIPGTYKPSAATAGAVTRYDDCDEYNSPTTELITLTANTEIPRQRIVYGRINKNGFRLDFEDGYLVGGRERPRRSNGQLVGTGVISDVSTNGTKDDIADIRDVTIAPRFPNQYLNCAHGARLHLTRCDLFWGVDGMGVYTLNGTMPTNFHAISCRTGSNVYYPGPYYARNRSGPEYLQTDGTWSASTTNAVKRTAASDVPWIDLVHPDGNHSDGIEAEGGYGRMTRDPVTGLWSGDGIYLLGNSFGAYSAIDNTGQGKDPSGKGVPVPGQAGSLPGSFLGFGDWRNRGGEQRPDMVRPIINSDKMLFNGEYAEATAVIIIQNVNQYPYPNAEFPNDYTVVGMRNFIDSAGTGTNTQKKSYSGIKLAWLENKYGPNLYLNGSTSPASAIVYGMRIGEKDLTQFAPALDGSPGLATNTWDDPQNIFGRNGQPLSDEGRNGGIRYG